MSERVEITRETFEAMREWRGGLRECFYMPALARAMDADPAFRPKTRAEQVAELLPEGWSIKGGWVENSGIDFGINMNRNETPWQHEVLYVNKASTLTAPEIVEMALRLAGEAQDE